MTSKPLSEPLRVLQTVFINAAITAVERRIEREQIAPALRSWPLPRAALG